MKPQSRFKRVLSTLGIFLTIAIVMYGFLALCNWNLHPDDWNGFSRFLLGVIGIVFLFRIFNEF